MSQVPSAQDPTQPPQAPLPPVSRGKKRRSNPVKEKTDKPKQSKKSKRNKIPQACPLPSFNRTSPANLGALAINHVQGYQLCFRSSSLKQLGMMPEYTPAEAGRQLLEWAKDNPVLNAELEAIWNNLESIHNQAMSLMNPNIQARFQAKKQREADCKERLQAVVLFLNRYGLRLPGLYKNLHHFFRTRDRALQLVGLEAWRHRKGLSLRLIGTDDTDGDTTQRMDLSVKLGDGFNIHLLHYFGYNHIDLGPTMDRVGLEIVENNIKRRQAEGCTTGIFKLNQDVMNHIAGFLFIDRILKNGYGPQACPS